MYDPIKYDIAKSLPPIDTIGKTIYLLGTAEKGPVMEPVLMTSITGVANSFGDTGSLVSAFRQMASHTHDCQIVGVKVAGRHARLALDVSLKGEELVREEAFILTSKDAYSLANKIMVKLTAETLAFYFPIEMGGGGRIYVLNQFEVLGMLMRAINEDTQNGLNHVWASTTLDQNTPIEYALFPCNADAQTLYGGDSGVAASKNDLYLGMAEAYDLFESAPFDIIVPLGAFLDDVYPQSYYGDVLYLSGIGYTAEREYLSVPNATFHGRLADFCLKQQKYGIPTHGVLGMNRLSENKTLANLDAYAIESYVDATPAGTRSGFKNSNDGFCLSCIIGDLAYPDGAVYPAYVAYALQLGMVSVAQSTTNQTIGDGIVPCELFDGDMLTALANRGLTAYRYSPLSGTVVASGVTMGLVGSDFHYICNVRMIQLVLSYVRQQLGKFIGEDIGELESTDAVGDAMRDLFDYMKTNAIIKDGNWQTAIDKASGVLDVAINLRTLFMVESVSGSVGASA